MTPPGSSAPNNTIGRLARLPDVFNVTAALLETGIPKNQINQVLWRWKCAGYIQALGNRSDVWFNLIADPVVDQNRKGRAIRMAFPAAMRAGHAVLMRTGVTTQMTHIDYFIRPARSAAGEIEGAQLHERPAVWMRRLQQAGAIRHDGDVPELDPGAALADLWLFDTGSIDLDDIDFEELPAQSLGILSMLGDYVDLSDLTQAMPTGAPRG